MMDYIPEVIFFKSFDKYYFKYNGSNYELSKRNLDYLKSVLNFPCAVEFYRCSTQIIKEIVNAIKKENSFTKLHKSEHDENTYQVILLNSFQQLRMIKKI